MTILHVVLGNQLFPIKHLMEIKAKNIYMREDVGLCTYEKHHKQKIIKGVSPLVVTAHTNYIKVQPLVRRVKKLIIFSSEI